MGFVSVAEELTAATGIPGDCGVAKLKEQCHEDFAVLGQFCVLRR